MDPSRTTSNGARFEGVFQIIKLVNRPSEDPGSTTSSDGARCKGEFGIIKIVTCDPPQVAGTAADATCATKEGVIETETSCSDFLST